MARNLWMTALGLGLMCLTTGCNKDEGAVSTAPEALGSTRTGDRLTQGKYVVDARSLRLAGFFRPSACNANPSTQAFVPGIKDKFVPDIAKGLPVGARLEEEYWIDMADLRQSISNARAMDASPAAVLTCRLNISPEGCLKVEYAGASSGLVAMRGSRATPGEVMRCHAVEADSRQPVQFVIAGVPGAQPGSMTLLFEHFLSDDVAQEMTAAIEGSDNLLVLEVAADGSLAVYPGVQS
jgi:hypothetical protein